MEQSIYLLLLTGLSLGLLHAFDADHIMAVSSLSKRSFSARQVALFCTRWALGHGATVIILALILIFFDWHLSEQISLWAERMIGAMLVVVGFILAYRFFKPKPTLNIATHRHADGTQHTHLVNNHVHHETHIPVLVGVIHGVAGSGPLLALLPSLINSAPAIGVGYVLAFSAGVLASMLCFGFLLGFTQNKLQQHSTRALSYVKLLLGIATSSLGGFWILSSL